MEDQQENIGQKQYYSGWKDSTSIWTSSMQPTVKKQQQNTTAKKNIKKETTKQVTKKSTL